MNSGNADNGQGRPGGARRALLCFAGAAAAASLAFGLAGIPAFAAGTSSSSASDSASGTNQAISASVLSASTDATSATDAAAVSAGDESTTLAEQVASKVLPSVGTVTCQVEYNDSVAIASGSCEVLDTDGHILTNYHVVAGATVISVNINDTDYDATLVGSDPTSDIAVLKIDAPDLTPIEIGTSSDLKPGEWVMTVGAPMGEEHSVSQGIVSGLDRSASVSLEDGGTAYYPGLIQSDAMINSGSSGGALVDSEGKLVGVTTLNYSTSGDFAGMSAAIPVDYAMGIVNQILATGQVEHPYMGIYASDVTPYNYQSAGSASYFGAYVTNVVSGSPAEEAGMQAGDVIIKVDGQDVYDAADVIVATREHEVGDDMQLTVERNGKDVDLTVTLESDLDNSAQTGVQSSAAGVGSASSSADDSSDSSSGGNGLGDIFSIFGGDNRGSGSNGGSGSDGSGAFGFGGSQSPYGYGNGYGYGSGNGYGYGYDDPGYGSDYGYGVPYGYGYSYGGFGVGGASSQSTYGGATGVSGTVA